jgi:hypothetical protein
MQLHLRQIGLNVTKEQFKQKLARELGMVAHSCNPIYFGGRDP